MSYLVQRLWAGVCLFLMTCVAVSTAAGEQGSAERVGQALEAMHRWVGEGANGEAWKRYLRCQDLQHQLRQAEQADTRVLEEILAQYASDAKGLDRRRFVAVRQALQSWLKDLSRPSLQELPAVVRAAKAEFVPVSPAEVATRREQLDRAVAELDRWLARSGSKNHSGWKKYLRWAALSEALATTSPQHLPVLDQTLSQLYADVQGLEHRRFLRLRETLHNYMNAYYFHQYRPFEKAYGQQLERLAAGLKAHTSNPNHGDTLSIGRLLGWVNRAGQAPEMVAAVRQYYWRPNAYAQVSRDLVAAGIEDDVDETLPVRETILGTSIRGLARTVGKIEVGLVPDSQQARLEIRLTGTASSNNVGYNRNVRIYSQGTTSIAARKQFRIDEEGLHNSRAVADCVTSSRINSISHRLRLVRNIAWRRARNSKSRAERIASGRAERRVEQRVDQQAAEMLAKANEAFHDKFRSPLVRRGEFPQQLRLRTTRQHVYVHMLQTNDYQIAASSDPPPLNAEFDLAVRVHESLVSNLSEAVLGGVTLTDEKAAELMEELTGEVPDELKTDTNEPWSITFSSTQPIRAEFRDEGFKIFIQGEAAQAGQATDMMTISAEYTMEKTPAGAKLTRKGEVEAKYVEEGFENARKIAVKTLMRKKFGALFKPEIVTEGLKLPGRWERAGKLKLRQMSSDQAWLVLGWLQPQNVRTAQAQGAQP